MTELLSQVRCKEKREKEKSATQKELTHSTNPDSASYTRHSLSLSVNFCSNTRLVFDNVRFICAKIVERLMVLVDGWLTNLKMQTGKLKHCF